MASKKFTKKDYDNIEKQLIKYNQDNDMDAAIKVCDLLIKGIVSGKLLINMVL